MGIVGNIAYKLLGRDLAKAKISETERIALERSDAGVEQGFFTGKPDWEKLRALPSADLSDEERTYLDTKGNELAARAYEWEIGENKDLPADMYAKIAEDRWWGLIAPKKYGGLGFSPVANSEAIIRFGSVSPELAVVFMVPNSLGPTEVLLHGGTEEQRQRVIPRIASGETAPCFALTSTRGGSDAFDGMENSGVVFRENGELKVKLETVSNRYITLAPLKGVGVLSFKLKDPENLLGKGQRLGGTLAVIPMDTPGLESGTRHNPMGLSFPNGPVTGKDVVLSLDRDIIGGRDGIGKATEWLMELLGAGRGISLPAMSTGGAKMTAQAVGSYARVRQQFGTDIASFPGIQDKLARIAGYTYVMDATRRTTLRMLQDHKKPTIASAIVKYHMTEMMDQVIRDGMDIEAGAAVMNGPRNMLAEMYKSVPIGKTVEGANVMTENLIIFGQGMMVDHPYLYKMITAAQKGDAKAFSKSFEPFVNNSNANFITSLTGIANAATPKDVHSDLKKYYEQINRYSAGFALTTATIAGVYQDKLKFAEDVTRRMGRTLSYMYIAMSVLEDFKQKGSHEDDLPLVHWAIQDQFVKLERNVNELFDNIPRKGLLKPVWATVELAVQSTMTGAKSPSDRLSHEVAHILTSPSETRDRLTAGIYRPSVGEKFREMSNEGVLVETKYVKPLATLVEAEKAAIAAEPAEGKFRKAIRTEEKHYQKHEPAEHAHIRQLFESVAEDSRPALLQAAFDDAVLNQTEYDTLVKADNLRAEAVAVDTFTKDMKPL